MDKNNDFLPDSSLRRLSFQELIDHEIRINNKYTCFISEEGIYIGGCYGYDSYGVDSLYYLLAVNDKKGQRIDIAEVSGLDIYLLMTQYNKKQEIPLVFQLHKTGLSQKEKDDIYGKINEKYNCKVDRWV
jgi:hypothetical protein